MAGYAHYLSLGRRSRVQFYGEVPSWLKRLPVQTEIVVRRRTLFGDDPVGIDEAGQGAGSVGASVEVWRWPIKASSPERAILEALDELPQRASFENLDKIFEGLVSLRPKHLMALLTACRSVKVRRLFLVFADRHQHPWRKCGLLRLDEREPHNDSLAKKAVAYFSPHFSPRGLREAALCAINVV